MTPHTAPAFLFVFDFATKRGGKAGKGLISWCASTVAVRESDPLASLKLCVVDVVWLSGEICDCAATIVIASGRRGRLHGYDQHSQ